MMTFIVPLVITVFGLFGYWMGWRDARKQTAQLRQWLEVIRDGATDERVRSDTLRQCAVDALEGKQWTVYITPL